MRILYKILSLCLCCGIFSCDFLDVVPDNTPTLDHAFKSRHEAQSFLYGCFGYLPAFGDAGVNPAILGGDEAWFIENADGWDGRLWDIARGRQNATSPLANYWESQQSGTGNLNGGTQIFSALSECNIFLENIHLPYDLGEEERTRWIAEVKFLKAYYHFWLLRQYGPIPLIKENVPVSAEGDAARIYRQPVDEAVEYIVSLLDEAVAEPNLPETIIDQQNEMGRPTKVMVLSVKAQVLLWAASPLLNGTAENAPEFSLVDKRGVELFPQTYSAEKWRKAADASKEAIDAAVAAGYALYDFRTANSAYAAAMNENSILAMQVRGAATERWNPEIIWGDSRGGDNTNNLQRACHPVFFLIQNGGGHHRTYAPTLQVVDQFYTRNGIPIEDDKQWEGVDPFDLRVAQAADKYYIKEGFRTIQLHFDREPRFYASIMFDGGTYYGNSRIANDNNLWVTEFKNGRTGGGPNPVNRHSSTGYVVKKMLHFRSSTPDNSSNALSIFQYGFPVIRLADLYLMYAEALNEVGDNTPDPDVYEYVDLVRARSGLNGVVESWHDHAVAGKQGKPLTKEGMREIIRRERMNELAFESSRFWDLRRWKLSEQYMNRPVRGLNISGTTDEEFYVETQIYQLNFQKRDYFWPIRTNVLLRNLNLVQNPEW
jgi:hypothetical protein